VDADQFQLLGGKIAISPRKQFDPAVYCAMECHDVMDADTTMTPKQDVNMLHYRSMMVNDL